ncbi:MAG: hypothetical protein ACOCUI_04030 [bacterium]
MLDKKETEDLKPDEIRDIVIESGMQLIPGVGSSLASLYFSTKQEKRFKRLERFYKELAKDIETIKEQIIFPTETNEDDFIALIEEINEAVERENVETKKNYLKTYFISLLTQPIQLDFTQKYFFITTLKRMTILEIEILIELYKDNKTIVVENIKKENVEQYAIVGSINRIKSYGFIMQTEQTWEGLSNPLKERILINDYGKSFCKFCLDN